MERSNLSDVKDKGKRVWKKKKRAELHDLVRNIDQSNMRVIGAQTTSGIKAIFEEMLLKYSKCNE